MTSISDAPAKNATIRRLVPIPLPDNIQSVQPGGGKCYALEMAWGRFRRAYLKALRPRYVAKMASLAKGSFEGCRHEILDPRDLKFSRNLCQGRWEKKDDPFQWRERIPFARWGLAELLLFSVPLLAATILLACFFWYLAPIPGALLALVVWFFRDPPRVISAEPGALVSPADGTITEITELPHDEFIGGPAVRIGMFLSLFNVHVNRAPLRARVIALRYSPGAFLNAQDPESSIKNENMWIGLEEETYPHRRVVARQVSGLVARRIVCVLRPGEVVERGEKFGMIKLGSRAELILPAGATRVATRLGDRVKGGVTVLARFLDEPALASGEPGESQPL